MVKVQNPPHDNASSHLLQGVPHGEVRPWIADMVRICQPDNIRVLTGSAEERQELLDEAVQQGTLIRLNQEKLPGCYLYRSHVNDVARSEQCTFICTPAEILAGPTNN